jgi:hypothetical protein
MLNKSTDEPSATSDELLFFLKDLSEFDNTESDFVMENLYRVPTGSTNFSITKPFGFSILHNKYTCNIGNCKKSFRSKVRYEKHSQSHFCERRFKCDVQTCGKVYKSKENLTLHIKNKHLGVRPYQCKFCEHTFSHRNGKIYHERKFHRDEMVYECSVGGKNIITFRL